MDTSISKTSLEEELLKKLKILNETTWENRANNEKVSNWLDNFNDQKEKLHALYLLSQFMYFNSMQMRTLLKALYRDLYKYKIIEKIRKLNGDSTDIDLINNIFNDFRVTIVVLGINIRRISIEWMPGNNVYFPHDLIRFEKI